MEVAMRYLCLLVGEPGVPLDELADD